MASSVVVGRLKQVERDVADLKQTVVQISEILLDLAECMDHGFESLGSRLDRLIAVTIEERTASTDRLRDIEERTASTDRLLDIERRLSAASRNWSVRRLYPTQRRRAH